MKTAQMTGAMLPRGRAVTGADRLGGIASACDAAVAGIKARNAGLTLRGENT